MLLVLFTVMNMKVGILGAGMSGLSCAFFLKKNGIEFEVLEADGEYGGLCQSIRNDKGFTFDKAGGHIFFTKDVEVKKLVNMLVKNMLTIRRNTKILFKGRYIKYPFENGLSDLPPEDNYECLIEFIKTLNEKYEKPKTFRDWIYQTFGKGIAERYMIPYNTKIWNCPPETMDTFWVDGRVPKPPVEDIIKSAIGIQTEGYTHQLNFQYPETGGYQAVPEAFYEQVKNKVLFNYKVQKVEQKGKKWIISDGKTEKTYDEIISTMPIFALQKAMNIPDKVNDAISKLRYNSIIMVLLGFDYPESTDMHWLYIPEMSTPTHRLIYLKNYTVKSSPDGKTSIISEITFNDGDKISKLSDNEIVENIVKDLHDRKLIDKNKLCYSRVCRTKYAYVVYDLNYTESINVVNNHFSSLPLYLCGRFSQFVYINSDGCIVNAKEVTDKLLAKNNIIPKTLQEINISL